MVIHKGDGVAWPRFDKSAIQNFPQIIARAILTRSMKIVMEGYIKESRL